MSPRAAWRLETLGFGEVYDYVAGKVDWFAAGLPSEGRVAETTGVGDLADRKVPTCTMDEQVGAVRTRLGPDGACLVVNERGTVLGLVEEKDLDADDHLGVGEVMQEGPSTIRPNVPAAVLASHLEEGSFSQAVVTTPEGELVGVLRGEELARWARNEGKAEIHDHDDH